MISVVVGNNVKKETKLVDKTRTLRSVLEEVGLDYTRGSMTIDGATLNPGDIDKSFVDLGITERCYLLNVVKADNA